MKRVFLSLMLGGVIVSLSGCRLVETFTVETIPELVEMEEELGVKLTERGVKYLVDPEKLVSGIPFKDGIPSIDNPGFVTLDEADTWIRDDEIVLGLVYKGVERAYPLQILIWHEIVNENIAGDPLLVTY